MRTPVRLCATVSPTCSEQQAERRSVTTTSQTHIATVLAPRVDPTELHTFSERWANIWGKCVKNPIGAVIIPGAPPYHENGYETSISNELLSSPDSQVIMGTTLLTEGSISTVVSVSRPYADGVFDATQFQLFAALIPHLSARRAAPAALGRSGRAADELGRNAEPAAAGRAVGRRAGANNLRQPIRREDARRARRSIPRQRRPEGRNARRHAPVAESHRQLRGADQSSSAVQAVIFGFRATNGRR